MKSLVCLMCGNLCGVFLLGLSFLIYYLLGDGLGPLKMVVEIRI